MARDITEGRSTRAIAVDIGVVSSTAIWQNTDIAYDIAIGGMPFILATNDERPYGRRTAPFKKDQFDASAEPGEQSLTGWWMRSQVSFHAGEGIKYFDTTHTSETSHETNRFTESENLDVWTKGEVTLLNKANIAGYTVTGLQSNGRSVQFLNSAKWTLSGTSYEGVIGAGEYNIVRGTSTGVSQPLVAVVSGQDKIYAATNDGEFVYYIVNEYSGSLKLHMYKKSLSAALADPSTLMFTGTTVVSNATMTYTKERIILGLTSTTDSKIFELTSTSSALGTAIYTHPNSGHIWSSATSSGSAIYVAGFNGIQSSIVKFTLTTSGTMPTLTSAITSAELPVGEIVHSIKHYLGHIMIGTNKGVRAADVSDQDGSITYGPLIVETDQPVYDFAARDRFIWCASGTTTGKQGLIRIDLSTEIEPLRFAYANDLQIDTSVDGGHTVAVAFLGTTNRLAFSNCSSINRVQYSITYKELTSNVATLTTSTAHGYVVGDAVFVTGVDSTFNSTSGFPPGSHKTITAVPSTTTFSYAKTASDVALTAVSPVGTVFAGGAACGESATELAISGYLKTGNIRYGTLEPKNFKRLLGRGDFTHGSMTLLTVDSNGLEYDHISYDSAVPPVEVTTSNPATAQEYVAYKFNLFRDSTTNSLGPIFKGYQAKATIATPRQRLIGLYVFNFDEETDKYNVRLGYKGRAYDRQVLLESIEGTGDVYTYQDLNTGENRQVQIESVNLVNVTPPDKYSTGFGGILEILVRTV